MYHRPVTGLGRAILSNPPLARALYVAYISDRYSTVKPHMSNSPGKLTSALRRAREDLRRAIEGGDLLCRGTLLKRTKLCGKSSCRCAKDPTARHGPYYEWGRMERDRLVHTMVSREQAAEIIRAIREHRRIQRLLRRWERESTRALLLARPPPR